MGNEFEQLYNALYMKVYSYAITLCRDAHTAEEITQATFFKALRTKSKFRQEAQAFTWLCAIAKNTFVDITRQNQRRMQAPVELPAPEQIEDAVEKSTSAEQLHAVIHALEEPYKEVFYLRVYGEMPFARIGQIFQKSENWARVTFHRAKGKILERMKEDE